MPCKIEVALFSVTYLAILTNRSFENLCHSLISSCLVIIYEFINILDLGTCRAQELTR